MIKSLFSYLTSALFFLTVSANALDNNVKTFKEFNAVVNLPADNWRWAEQILPGTLCAASDGKGNVFSFFAAEDKDFQIGDAFSETFEKGFFSEGDYNKIKSGVITFENLPCYELVAELNKKKLVSLRIFSAQGIFYRMDVICDIGTKLNIDDVFSCFKFEKQPSLQVAPNQPDKKKEPVAGFIIGLIIGTALLLYMFKVIFSKKREQ